MNVNKLAGKLELLKNRMKNHSFLTFEDSSSIDVEYCREVIKLEEEQIVLRLARGYIRIIGTQMNIRNYAYECVKISGKIYSVTFEENYEKK